MSIISCPECGKQISDKALACPECGCPINASSEFQANYSQEENSKKIANLYERARKSLEVDDLEHAAEYYKQILDENPNDWEAYFYSYLGEFTTFTNAQAASVADKLSNTIPAAYEMAVENCDIEEASKRVKVITEKTSSRLVGIALTGASLLREYEGGNILTPTGKVHSDLYKNIRPTAVNTIANCILAYSPLESKLEDFLHNNRIDVNICKECLLHIRRARYELSDMQFSPSSGLKEHVIKAELIYEYAQKVNELDPTFEIPSLESKTNAGGGCYVATCVYGSYDCPQVWTLRRYRDDTLALKWYGRAFIKTYYAISPNLVKWFGKTKWFKKMWQGKLDRMVKTLQEKGVESTPYQDKVW